MAVNLWWWSWHHFFSQFSVLSLPLPNIVSLLLESVLHCCVPDVYCLRCTRSDFELRTVGLKSNLRWRVARSSRARFLVSFIVPRICRVETYTSAELPHITKQTESSPFNGDISLCFGFKEGNRALWGLLNTKL